MSAFRKITSFFIAFFATFIMFQTDARADSLTRKKAAGEPIIFGYANLPPFAFTNLRNEPAGLVNALAFSMIKGSLGYKVTHRFLPWDDLVPALNSGRIDVITAGLYITGERCNIVQFADPMTIGQDSLVVLKGNPKNLHNFKDIVDKNATFVTGRNYAISSVARREGIRPDKIITTTSSVPEILDAVRLGHADAAGLNYQVAGMFMPRFNNPLERVDPKRMPPISKNWIAIAVRKGDTDFLKEYNPKQKEFLLAAEGITKGHFGYMADIENDLVPAAHVCAIR